MLVRPGSAVLMAVLACSLSGCRTPEQKRDRFLKQAQAPLKSHDFGRAILLLRSAARAVPKDPEPHYQLALAYFEAGDMSNAVGELKKTLDLDPQRTVAQLKLAELYSLSRNKELILLAEMRTKAVLDRSPDDADALHTLAMAEFGLGKEQDAIEHLQRAVERAPDYAKAPIALAMIKVRNGENFGAEEVLKRAVERSPKSSELALTLGLLYMGFRKYGDAEKQLQKAVDLNPQDAGILLALGNAKLINGKEAEAGQILQRVSVLGDPRYKPVYAAFLLQQGKLDAAIAELKSLYKSNPDSRVIRSYLVGAYFTAGKPDEAQAVLNKVLAKNPKDVEATVQLCELLIKQQKLDEAEKALLRVFQYQPDSPQGHFLMAEIDRLRGSGESQKRELNEALRVDPAFLAARMRLMRIYLDRKDLHSALELLDRAPESQKSNVEVQVARNWILLESGDLGEMGRSLESSLKTGRSPDFLLQKGVLEARQNHMPEARASLEAAFNQNPDDVRALDALMKTYADRGQRDIGVAKLREFASQHPNSARLQHLLGEWLLKAGNFPEARAAFVRAKAADPRYQPANWALARLDLLEAKFDEARKILESSTGSDPSSIEPQLLLAIVEEFSGDTRSAIARYRNLIHGNPHNFVVMNNLAYLLTDHHSDQPAELEEALRYAQDALRLEPEHPALQDTVGWIYYRKGMYLKSLPYIEKAVQLDGTARRRYHLAMVYLKAGQADAGQRVLTEAMHMNPNLPEAMAALQVQAEASRGAR